MRKSGFRAVHGAIDLADMSFSLASEWKRL